MAHHLCEEDTDAVEAVNVSAHVQCLDRVPIIVAEIEDESFNEVISRGSDQFEVNSLK